MMRRQHEIAAMGKTGRTPYYNGNPTSPYGSSDIHPYLFRAEVPDGQHRFDGDPFKLCAEDTDLLRHHNAFPQQHGFIEEGLKPFGIATDSVVRTEYKADGSFFRKAPLGAEEKVYRAAVI